MKDEEKIRGMWKIGLVERLINSKDDVMRGPKIRVGQTTLQRVLPHLYQMELPSGATVKTVEPTPRTTELRVDVPEFKPSRNAAAIAECRMKDVIQKR